MKKTQLAINSISTSGKNLEERVGAYRTAGFRNVEFFLPHVKEHLVAGRSVAEVRRLLNDHDLRCIGGFEGAVLSFASREALKRNEEEVLANCRLISELGGGVLVVGTDGPESPPKDPLGNMARRFAAIGKKIRELDVAIAVEFNWGPLLKSLRAAAEVARRSEAQNIGVLFDPAHYHCTPTKFGEINAENVPFIKHVHVNDMADRPGELSHCNDDRKLPGEGVLDLQRIFRAIERHGYRGYFSIEMFDRRLWKMAPRRAAADLYRSLTSLCSGNRAKEQPGPA